MSLLFLRKQTLSRVVLWLSLLHWFGSRIVIVELHTCFLSCGLLLLLLFFYNLLGSLLLFFSNHIFKPSHLLLDDWLGLSLGKILNHLLHSSLLFFLKHLLLRQFFQFNLLFALNFSFIGLLFSE